MILTERTQRMVDSAPEYYENSDLFMQYQAAVSAELDKISADEEDIRLQKRIKTATWGLMYWEEVQGMPVVESDPYDIRRSRVLSKWRGVGNFSADLIESVAEAFINGEVSVRMRVPQQEVVVTFIGWRGIPPNLDDLKVQLENIIHATNGLAWRFTYLNWNELDNTNMTWDQLDALEMTWDEFEIWKP